MENMGKMLEEAYKLLHSDKQDEAAIKLEEMHSLLKGEEIKEGDDNFGNYVSCLLGLGEVYMKKGDMKTSLEYYLEGNVLSSGKDFNVLFNLGVVYRNLGEEKKCQEFLELAKAINPTDQNLMRFMGEDVRMESNQQGSGDKFDPSFEEKIQAMLKEINVEK